MSDQPDLRKLGFSIQKLIPILFENWCPFPDIAYAKMVGWLVLEDGTIETPGVGRVPSRELCEEADIKRLLELEDPRDIDELEELIKLKDPR
jgi:hypothetical protein